MQNIKIYNFTEITSTNDYARELLADNVIVCVTADYQTAGRGRNQNKWYGDFGNNLYISFGIKHNSQCSILKLAALQAIGALAVKKSLEVLTGSMIFKLKYPNDVYAKDENEYKKISGILIEHGFSGSDCIHSIIGIGININEVNFNKEIEHTATSLKRIGYEFHVRQVQDILLDNILNLFDKKDSEIMSLWESELEIYGKSIKILNEPNEAKLEFFAKEILEDGRLKLINNNGVEKIIDNGDTIRYNFN